MAFQLPALDYEYNALEPNIDAETMQIHYTKHHQGYVNNLNKLTEGTAANNMDIDMLNAEISKYPMGVRNNGGGHYNHCFFWKTLSPNGGSPSEDFLNAVNNKFNSLDDMKLAFEDVATKRFGSGWGWLILNKNNELELTSTPNQDNPAMDIAETPGVPLIGCDVWEHAYYLNYQNRRGDYLKNFWNVVNWEEVSRRYSAALK